MEESSLGFLTIYDPGLVLMKMPCSVLFLPDLTFPFEDFDSIFEALVGKADTPSTNTPCGRRVPGTVLSLCRMRNLFLVLAATLCPDFCAPAGCLREPDPGLLSAWLESNEGVQLANTAS